jgi:hypothetical protein
MKLATAVDAGEVDSTDSEYEYEKKISGSNYWPEG